jgi:membrane peptidoglycan carboxypeptidase
MGLGAGWLFYYSRDLPDTSHLDQFVPPAKTQVAGDCLGVAVSAIPFSQFGKNLQDAAITAEPWLNRKGVLASQFGAWKSADHNKSTVSMQIARTLFCNSREKILSRELSELRLAAQLDRHFTREQLFAIYLNRAWFGECGNGVENAAECIFHKSAANLDLSEAALIAGMMRSPAAYSPFKNPDRALARRNEVLDAMAASGKLSQLVAQEAKSQPLVR